MQWERAREREEICAMVLNVTESERYQEGGCRGVGTGGEGRMRTFRRGRGVHSGVIPGAFERR